MKPRILRTYPILAVAVVACSHPSPPEVRPERVEPPAQASVTTGSPVGAPPAQEDHDQGSAAWAVYRPPTDADGYPLVGNMMRKGGNEKPDAGADAGRASEGW